MDDEENRVPKERWPRRRNVEGSERPPATIKERARSNTQRGCERASMSEREARRRQEQSFDGNIVKGGFGDRVRDGVGIASKRAA